MNDIKNNNVISRDIMLEIYLYYPIEEILGQKITSNELWAKLLKRDYKLLDYITPQKTYLQQYEKPYQQKEKRYIDILNYIIYILIDKYIFIETGKIESKEYLNKTYPLLIEMETSTYIKHCIKEDIDITESKEKILKNKNNTALLIDDRLTQITLIDDSQTCHLITNLYGIELYDLIFGIYVMKSSDFDKWYEQFDVVKHVTIDNLSNYKKQMTISLNFNYI